MSVMNDMNDAEYALKVRVATLEALIRDVAIPALEESMRMNDCDSSAERSLYDMQDADLTKLREAIK